MYVRIAAGLLLLIAIVLLWAATPDGTLTVDGISHLLAPLRAHWWGPLVSTAAMAVALLLFAPMTPMVAALVLAHGPWMACAVGVVGTVLGAAMGHAAGRFVLRDSLGDRLARALPNLADQLLRRSVRPTVVLRLMPGFPFSLMNALAGSAGVPLRYFLLGTGLTAVPIVAIMVWVSQGVIRALRTTDPLEAIPWIAGAAVLIAFVVLAVRRLRRGSGASGRERRLR